MLKPEKLRAWYFQKQGLDGSLKGAATVDVLARSGWARSVGGVGPYLTFFSRAGTSREDVDKAVAKLAIHELPAARNCTYVLPAADFALGLKAGQSFWGNDFRVAAKLGVTEKEIDKLCEGVVAALAKEELSPDDLRTATGKLSRSLGEEGKKKGVTTTLPLALGKLQAHGEIRRVPANGRLDQQRYRYTAWRPNPLAKFKLTDDQVFVELARKYFSWIGPATASQFQEFSGLGVKAAKAILEQLKLEDVGNGLLLLSAERDAFEKFAPGKQASYALVSSLDSIAIHRRSLRELLTTEDLPKTHGLSDLPSHAILDRGRVVGLWEYDTATNSIAWASFVPKNRDLEAAVRLMEVYVREQLGDARSFSLDSPTSRAPKIAALRKGL